MSLTESGVGVSVGLGTWWRRGYFAQAIRAASGAPNPRENLLHGAARVRTAFQLRMWRAAGRLGGRRGGTRPAGGTQPAIGPGPLVDEELMALSCH